MNPETFGYAALFLLVLSRFQEEIWLLRFLGIASSIFFMVQAFLIGSNSLVLTPLFCMMIDAYMLMKINY